MVNISMVSAWRRCRALRVGLVCYTASLGSIDERQMANAESALSG